MQGGHHGGIPRGDAPAAVQLTRTAGAESASIQFSLSFSSSQCVCAFPESCWELRELCVDPKANDSPQDEINHVELRELCFDPKTNDVPQDELKHCELRELYVDPKANDTSQTQCRLLHATPPPPS